jgi:hypothetical protein
VFRKLFTLLMVFAIFTVQASASTQNGLKAAFDEMNYSLTVEWDQEDRNFYESQLKKFTSTVRELQKSGLTNAQMIEFAKTQVKDAKVAKDLETAFSMITINKMSSEEASKYMMDSMKRAYSNGASWNGEVLVYLAVGLLIVALAVGLASGSRGGGSSNGGGGTVSCYDDCYYYDYQCGYDWYGWPVYCEGYTCDRVCY